MSSSVTFEEAVSQIQQALPKIKLGRSYTEVARVLLGDSTLLPDLPDPPEVAIYKKAAESCGVYLHPIKAPLNMGIVYLRFIVSKAAQLPSGSAEIIASAFLELGTISPLDDEP